MAYEKGTVLRYIGHTEACKEECGWPCCAPGTGCPWEERIGTKAVVTEPTDDLRGIPVEFEDEPNRVFWIRYPMHVSLVSKE
jgi:hypothetical protein